MTATAALSLDDLGRLNDAALEVLLRHGVARPSIDVELDLWRSLEEAYRREQRTSKWLRLTGPRTSSRQEVLSALTAAAFQVALDSGTDESELTALELDLLFAFQLVEVNEEARAVLAA